MNAQNNVIHFPNRKPPTDDNSTLSPNPPPKKQWKIVSAIAIVFAVTLLSNHFADQNKSGSVDLASTGGGRAIASVGEREVLPEERDARWEKSLARQIQGSARRDIASLKLGHSPTIEEELRFGVLKGQYAVEFENGKVHSIRLPSSQSEAQVYIGDSKEFLKRQRALLPLDFTRMSQVHKTIDANGSVEVVSFEDHSGLKTGEARFEYDQYGHFRELQIQASTSVRQ